MTALHTKHGFPVARELDFTGLRSTLRSRGTGVTQPKKKKSLFAMQFVDKKLDFFGIDTDPLTAQVGIDSKSRKDDVEQTFLARDMECGQAGGNGGVTESEEGMKEEENEECESSPAVLCDWYVYIHVCCVRNE